jgi:hypothetical protein
MKKVLIFCVLIIFSTIVTANTTGNDKAKEATRIAIQTALTTGGNATIGLVLFAPKYEIGVFGGGKIINNNSKTELFTPGAFAGGRYFITNSTIFAFGLDLLGKFGKDNGENIQQYYGIGPYVSLEQMLTYHVMLSIWYDPYFYEYEKTNKVTTTTHNFGSGGIGVEYLF